MNDTVRIIRTLIILLFFMVFVGAFVTHKNNNTEQYSEVITIEEENEPQGWIKTEGDKFEEELRQEVWNTCMRSCKTYGSFDTGNCNTDCNRQIYVVFGK